MRRFVTSGHAISRANYAISGHNKNRVSIHYREFAMRS